MTKSIIIRFIQIILSIVILAGLFFMAAGHLYLLRAWIFFITILIYFGISGLIMIKINPEVVSERGKLKKGTKIWDKILITLILLVTLFSYIVAGLDVGRFKWTNMSIYFIIPGIILYLLASVFIQWAIAVNKYFEGTVRIQKDRDHHVISKGPYKILRHPGYLGIILQNLLFPFIIGSVYAFIPAILIMLILVIRTYLEDKTLFNELNGYADYTKKVRFRLFPGIW